MTLPCRGTLRTGGRGSGFRLDQANALKKEPAARQVIEKHSRWLLLRNCDEPEHRAIGEARRAALGQRAAGLGLSGSRRRLKRNLVPRPASGTDSANGETGIGWLSTADCPRSSRFASSTAQIPVASSPPPSTR